MKWLSRASLALVFAFTLVSAFAADSGSIHGTITDPLGALLPNATVQLLQEGRPASVTATDPNGAYNFTSLSPGHYQIRASASAFATQESSVIYVGGGQSAQINLALAIGTVSQQISVTATGLPVPESQIGASVTVIDRSDFQDKLDVLEPLRQVAGAQIVQTGQRGGATSLFIRGGDSNANKVLIDGLPVNDIGGAVNFGAIANTGIEQLEVLRGPNSVLYGSDALAGVVSLTTRRGTTPLPEFSYSLDGGNFNSIHHDASVGGAYRSEEH